MIVWALGLILLAGVAYYILSTQALGPAIPAPCNKCPHANSMKTNVEPWQ